MPVSPEQVQRIAAALEAKGASVTCPRCIIARFAVLDLYGPQVATDNPDQALQRVMMCALLHCTNCGYMAMHDLGTLGISP
jgi:hypothetical protein